MSTRTDAKQVQTWPYPRLGEAIEALGRQTGLQVLPATPPIPHSRFADVRSDLDNWIEGAAETLGIHAEPVELLRRDVTSRLRSGKAFLCRVPGTGTPEFLLVLKSTARTVHLLAPDLTRQRLTSETFREVLFSVEDEQLRQETQAMLATVSLPARRSKRVATSFIENRTRNRAVSGWWQLRPATHHRFRHRLKQEKTGQNLALLIGMHSFRNLLWVGSWWLLGRGALSGHLDAGWLIAWALLLITIIPVRTAVVQIRGRLAIRIGAAIKEQLLSGALQMKPDQLRSHGYGTLLGKVHESEALESLAFSGGLGSALAVVELVMAIGVLSTGAGGPLHGLLLLLWITAVTLLLLAFRKHLSLWTESRVEITGSLVENMTGHRTRMVQERTGERHRDEDRLVENYLERSRRRDRLHLILTSTGNRGWIVLGLAGLAPAFIGGEHGADIAVSIGGILLAASGLGALLSGITQLLRAEVAWHNIAPLFRAAMQPSGTGHPDARLPLPTEDVPQTTSPLIRCENLIFRHRQQGPAILHGASLSIHRGDRVLLEGPSGGGKSTFASLLLGLREQESGLLLIEGLDRATLGPAGLRNRIAGAPQFHENHVLIGTFAFNLLMGRNWPPREEDLREAFEVCSGLGLDKLLERMPGGMGQMVGETGWQLSHGERSRLFIARALLQRSRLIILDESFGSLDPETLRTVVDYVTRRTQTLLAIAHP